MKRHLACGTLLVAALASIATSPGTARIAGSDSTEVTFTESVSLWLELSANAEAFPTELEIQESQFDIRVTGVDVQGVATEIGGALRVEGGDDEPDSAFLFTGADAGRAFQREGGEGASLSLPFESLCSSGCDLRMRIDLTAPGAEAITLALTAEGAVWVYADDDEVEDGEITVAFD